MIRHYLGACPAESLARFLEQYAEALWIEDRQINVTAAAIARAVGNGKN